MSSPSNDLKVKWLTDAAGITRQAYYKWVAEADSRKAREERDRSDFNLILKAYQYRGIDKGAKGIHMRLLHMNPPVIMNEKKIRRLMRKFGLFCPIRKPNPYKARIRQFHESSMADNIVDRQFQYFNPREAFSTDISYLYYKHGRCKCYLSVIRDFCTHEILAQVVSPSLAEDFVLDTINQLYQYHGSEICQNAIVHSDQGIHYQCLDFSRLLRDKHLRQSMSRRANCWDNAPQESFFGHMKDEIRLKILECETHYDVRKVINEYVEYYNTERGQWSLAKLTPQEYYEYRKTGEYPLLRGRSKIDVE